MITPSTYRVLLVSGGMFLSLGLLSAIGPALPELARNNHSSLSAIGAVLTALFLGAIPAQLLSGWLNSRFGARLVLTVALLTLAVGLIGATASRYLPLTIACMGFAGLGDGILVVMSNVMLAQTFTKRSASILNLMNVFYGVGAILGPTLAGAALGLWNTSLPALWLISLVLGLIVFLIPGLRVGKAAGDGQDIIAAGSSSFYRSPVLWLLCSLLLLYVGMEVGTGDWTPTYVQRTVGLSLEAAAPFASGFYLALTGGRLAGAGLGAKLSAELLLFLSLVGALIGGAILAFGVGSAGLTLVGILVLGASLGPVYPTVVAIAATRFSAEAGKAASLVITAGSLGGVLFPAFQGILLDNVGAPSVSLSVALVTVLMLALFGALYVVTRRG